MKVLVILNTVHLIYYHFIIIYIHSTTQWRIMFEQAMNTEGFRREWVWAIPFDNKFKPENPFVKLFSPIGGSYLVKPSQQAMDMWANEQQRPAQGTPGIPYDARGILSVKNIGGQPAVMKYLYNYINNTTNLLVNILQKIANGFCTGKHICTCILQKRLTAMDVSGWHGVYSIPELREHILLLQAM